MIYPADAELDGDGRLTECPKCGNRKFSPKAERCGICGASRRNICLARAPGKRHVNPVNARYCETCGAITAFNDYGMLRPWEELNPNIHAQWDWRPVERPKKKLPF